MANDLTAVTPKLLAMGLLALRQQSIMPRLVNRRLEALAGEKGSTIDVPVPAPVPASDVVPANVAPNPTDQTPTSVPIALNQWKEAPFQLTDKDLLEAANGYLPMQASEAIKSIANAVDQHILSKYIKIYGFHGTPGVTPIASGTTDVTQTRKILQKQLAPVDDRHFVLDPDAEASALDQRAFQDLSWNGQVIPGREGVLTRRFGFDWWSDQNMPTHTTGTLSDGSAHQALVNGALSLGVTTMNIDSTTLTGTLVPGDIFTFANHSQTYVVTNSSALTASGNAITGVTFAPALQLAVPDNTALVVKGTHAVNLAFHRDWLAFATRPLTMDAGNLGSIMQSAVDEISGLTLRLEVRREYKRTRWSFDTLWGADVVRRELCARLAG